MSDNQRQHPRTNFKAKIKLWHPSFNEILVSTRDISDGGVFILIDPPTMPPIGERVKGQVQGMPVEAPLVEMEIVRVAADGLGLKFC